MTAFVSDISASTRIIGHKTAVRVVPILRSQTASLVLLSPENAPAPKRLLGLILSREWRIGVDAERRRTSGGLYSNRLLYRTASWRYIARLGEREGRLIPAEIHLISVPRARRTEAENSPFPRALFVTFWRLVHGFNFEPCSLPTS